MADRVLPPPKSDSRLEAAARAAYEWDADKSDSPTWDEYDEGAKGWYREIARVALEAADEVRK